MKYSSTKASNAPIESNHIKKGNKTNKTPIKVQPIELNTIFGLFVNRKKNSTKKKETKTKTTQCSPERKQQRNLKENKEMKQSHKEIYMMLMGDSKKRDDYCKYKSCLTEMSRLSVMRRGIERVLSKKKITNKPIVDVKRNDNAKTKEFFTTFFKSEISKRNRNLSNNGDMFYTERKNNNNTNLNNERKKGYDTVVSMMKSKMKLYGIVSPVKNKKSHY